MKPIKMKPIELNTNVVFGANQEGFFPLPAYKDDNGDVYTTWELTEEERAEVMKTGRIYLIVQTFNRGFNPVFLTVENPFIEQEQQPKAEPTHIRVISVPAVYNPNFENIKVGSIHKILDPVNDIDTYVFADGGEPIPNSVWVLGTNEPVILLSGEFEYVTLTDAKVEELNKIINDLANGKN